MQQIVEDGPEAPLFSVLRIIRLDGRESIEFGATAFAQGTAPTPVDIRVQPRPDSDPTVPGHLIAWAWKRPGWWPTADIDRRKA